MFNKDKLRNKMGPRFLADSMSDFVFFFQFGSSH